MTYFDRNVLRTLAIASLALASSGLRAQETRSFSNPTGFATPLLGTTTLFSAADDGIGFELYRTGGTSPSTSLVRDINPGAADAHPDQLTPLGIGPNAPSVFVADGGQGDELWITDGTGPGTTLLADIRPGPAGSLPRGLVVLGSLVLFSADDGSSGRELWRTDGTTAGTVRVADIRPGGLGSRPRDLAVLGNRVYFSADDGVTGRELWASDGTAAGTVRVHDTHAGAAGSNPTGMTALGGVLLFSADDGTAGQELWRHDPGAATTTMVRDIQPGAGDSAPLQLTPSSLAGWVYFAANDGVVGRELWRSDGTAAGTVLVRDIRPGPLGSHVRNLTAGLLDAWFSADDGTTGHEPWHTDGSAAGTTLLRDIRPGAADSLPREFAFAGTRVVFSADDGTTGRELWRSDGTSQGTALLVDVRPGPASSLPTGLRAASLLPLVFFGAHDGATGLELWATDGTAAGTGLVRDINPGLLQPQLDVSTSAMMGSVQIDLAYSGLLPGSPIASFLAPSAGPAFSVPGVYGEIRLTPPIVALPPIAADLTGMGTLSLVAPPATTGVIVTTGAGFIIGTGDIAATKPASISLGSLFDCGSCQMQVKAGSYCDATHEFIVPVEGNCTGWVALVRVLPSGEAEFVTDDLGNPLIYEYDGVSLSLEGIAPIYWPEHLQLRFYKTSTPPNEDTSPTSVLWTSYC